MEATKKQKALKAYKEGNIKKALMYIKNFYMDFNKEEQRVIQIAYESMTGKESFYSELKINTLEIRNKADEILKRYFK